ncbi:hypothetical protein SNEBB_005101 [Seison nebaliae]|nr:hypothetical protein SNEBB_005101 [Seison nebaliae]
MSLKHFSSSQLFNFLSGKFIAFYKPPNVPVESLIKKLKILLVNGLANYTYPSSDKFHMRITSNELLKLSGDDSIVNESFENNSNSVTSNLIKSEEFNVENELKLLSQLTSSTMNVSEKLLYGNLFREEDFFIKFLHRLPSEWSGIQLILIDHHHRGKDKWNELKNMKNLIYQYEINGRFGELHSMKDKKLILKNFNKTPIHQQSIQSVIDSIIISQQSQLLKAIGSSEIIQLQYDYIATFGFQINNEKQQFNQIYKNHPIIIDCQLIQYDFPQFKITTKILNGLNDYTIPSSLVLDIGRRLKTVASCSSIKRLSIQSGKSVISIDDTLAVRPVPSLEDVLRNSTIIGKKLKFSMKNILR